MEFRAWIESRYGAGAEYIARARGFNSAEEMRAHREGSSDHAHARDLQTAKGLEREIREHSPSLRSDVLAAELRTARTPAERRSAVKRFMESQRSPEEVRFTNWLADSNGDKRAYEDRAMGEGATTTGGALVPQRFYGDVIRQAKEFSGFIRDFENWTSEHGEATNRPVAAAYGSAGSLSENPTTFTDGPQPTLSQQAWNLAPTYAASYTASNQLIQDAFRYTTTAQGWDPINNGQHIPGFGVVGATAPGFTPNPTAELDALISSALGESLGRGMAPAGASALYAGVSAAGAASLGNSGGFLGLGAATAVTFATGATTELAAGTISLDTAAQLMEYLDADYLATASWYFSTQGWAGITRQVDAQKHIQVSPGTGTRTLYGIPVVLTSQVSAATASTVGGVVLGDLSRAMTMRVVGGSFHMLRSAERFAEFAQTFFRAFVRADFAVRDPRAMVGIKYAAT